MLDHPADLAALAEQDAAMLLGRQRQADDVLRNRDRADPDIAVERRFLTWIMSSGGTKMPYPSRRELIRYQSSPSSDELDCAAIGCDRHELDRVASWSRSTTINALPRRQIEVDRIDR